MLSSYFKIMNIYCLQVIHILKSKKNSVMITFNQHTLISSLDDTDIILRLTDIVIRIVLHRGIRQFREQCKF
jgi:hypothetical protein